MPTRFMATLSAIEQAGTRLFNPLRVCQWNLNKAYLRDLQQQGVPIVPTQWMDRLDETRLANLFSQAVSSSRLVVKPTIGANADGVFVLPADEKDQFDRVVKQYATRPCMVQPFLNSIQTTGEYSLCYFGGRYSHAILKQPKTGDFRVQEEHGGIIRAITPSGPIVHTATQALNAVGETLLYARVDIVLLDDGSPAVTELELIEPSLYFSYDSRIAPTIRRSTERDVDAMLMIRTGNLRQDEKVRPVWQSRSYDTSHRIYLDPLHNASRSCSDSNPLPHKGELRESCRPQMQRSRCLHHLQNTDRSAETAV